MKASYSNNIHSLAQSSNDSAFKSLISSSENIKLSRARPPELATESDLCFVSTPELAQIALSRNVKNIIALEKVALDLKEKNSTALQNLWSTSNIQKALSLVLPFFDDKPDFKNKGIHPMAFIDPMAEVHPTASIGPFCVVEAYAKVGENTELISNVYVGSHCEIGRNCRIAPHTTIGSDGFGFVSDKNYNHTKIPQIGKVVIEDNCEIGANCAFDRATLSETRIKKGTKFDNLCHVAHNVTIGENSLITAGFIVAGSTIIGKNFTTAGGVHVVGHIKITDNVVMTGRAAATNDITEPGMYGGFPLETHRESVKTLVSLPTIKVLRKQVNKILKHLNLEE